MVTGASSGIGLEFSRELARRGCSVLLVSNQREALEQTAAEIEADFSVKAVAHYCDLTEPQAAASLLGYIDSREDIPLPDYLVNNAGIFSFRPVTETSEKTVNLFIDLHVRALTELSRTFGERMARRGHGRILNMSSMSCWMPMPGIALYSATKAYIRVFSRALHYELRDSGVSVTVACPGGMDTGLFGLPMHLRRLAVRLGAIQKPEKFVKKAVDRMLQGRAQYINGALNRLSIVFVGILPAPLRLQVKRRLLDRGVRVN